MGIRLVPGIHELMAQAAGRAKSPTGAKMTIGEAYSLAAMEWLRKQAASDSILKHILEERPELRSFGVKKQNLLANRA